jgi:hypothetical protein
VRKKQSRLVESGVWFEVVTFRWLHINIFGWRNNQNNAKLPSLSQTSANSSQFSKRDRVKSTATPPSAALTTICLSPMQMHPNSQTLWATPLIHRHSRTTEEGIRMANWIEFCTKQSTAKRCRRAAKVRNVLRATACGSSTTTHSFSRLPRARTSTNAATNSAANCTSLTTQSIRRHRPPFCASQSSFASTF